MPSASTTNGESALPLARGSRAPGVPSLRIRLFGGLAIERDDWPEPARLTRGAETLLAYLVLQRRRRHARDELAGTFWGDLPDPRARACLNTALWRMRQVLEAEPGARGRYIETSPAGGLRFGAAGGYWLDVAEFEQVLDAIAPLSPARLDADAIGRLAGATHLYAGDLLAGVFDDWALIERERLRARYVDAEVLLMAAHRSHGHLPQSIEAGMRALAVDPLREPVHRELMDIYCDSGQPAQAVRQYDACRRVLRGQLGIAPDQRTEALRSQLEPMNGAQSNGAAPHDLRVALDLLTRADEAVREARRRVGEALDAAVAVTPGADGDPT